MTQNDKEIFHLVFKLYPLSIQGHFWPQPGPFWPQWLFWMLVLLTSTSIFKLILVFMCGMNPFIFKDWWIWLPHNPYGDKHCYTLCRISIQVSGVRFCPYHNITTNCSWLKFGMKFPGRGGCATYRTFKDLTFDLGIVTLTFIISDPV